MITKFAEKDSFQLVNKPFNKLRKKYGLKQINNYLLEMEGDQNLICDLPELFPQNNLTLNCKSIGSLIYKVNKQEGVLLQNLPAEKPIIFICMESTGNWKALSFLNNEFYNHIPSLPLVIKKKNSSLNTLFLVIFLYRGRIECFKFNDLSWGQRNYQPSVNERHLHALPN